MQKNRLWLQRFRPFSVNGMDLSVNRGKKQAAGMAQFIYAAQAAFINLVVGLFNSFLPRCPYSDYLFWPLQGYQPYIAARCRSL
jgi:hypothetical protein